MTRTPVLPSNARVSLARGRGRVQVGARELWLELHVEQGYDCHGGGAFP
jgi:hypothetical protein